MELTIEGTTKRSWFLGRRRVTLSVRGSIPTSAERNTLLLALFQTLSLAFSARLAPQLLPRPETSFHLLPVLANLTRRREPIGLRLRNLRGTPQQSHRRERSGSEFEVLLSVRGVVELPAEDLPENEAEESSPREDVRRETFLVEVLSYFETFQGKGQIEYAVEYREQIPGELREIEGSFLSDCPYPLLIEEFRFATDSFRSSAPGMSAGLVPSVDLECRWSWEGDELRLYIAKELEKGESPETLRNLPALADFDRALESHGLYRGLTESCIRELR